jgi:hypothetical protein
VETDREEAQNEETKEFVQAQAVDESNPEPEPARSKTNATDHFIQTGSSTAP